MKTILFDLDGTLINSKPGITKCAQYALAAFGIEEPDLDKLEFFIGPPLVESFQKHYGFAPDQARLAVDKYRERYHTVGIFECELYPGVEDTLRTLKNAGYRIAMASSKPEVSCRQILEHFGLTAYFDEIAGATLDGRLDSKISVLREAMRRMEITDVSEACLVGDTRFDVLGAKEAGMDCLGVTYGFGTKEELLACGAVAVVNRMGEVQKYFVKIKTI